MSDTEEKFECLPMYEGFYYQPRQRKGAKKHACPDCHFCQECSPSRCNVCRGQGQRAHCKLSLQEQIALYDQINSKS